MDDTAIKYFVESALFAAGRPLSIDQIQTLFDGRSAPEKSEIRAAIKSLLEDYTDRGITISEVASGFRVQIEGDMVERLQKLWEERPPRYSRANDSRRDRGNSRRCREFEYCSFFIGA